MTRYGTGARGQLGPAASVTLIWMQIFKSWGVGWRQEGLSIPLLSCQQSHIMWDWRQAGPTSHFTLGTHLDYTNSRRIVFFLRVSGPQCRLNTGHNILPVCCFYHIQLFLYKSCMWDIFWIKKAACITKGQWEDRASTCPHRTLFRHHSTPTLPDTIMCQTWIRTHSRRGVGDLRMEPHGRTGAHTVWDHPILFPHPWTTRLQDRFLTVRLSTVTCILQELRCYSRRRRT